MILNREKEASTEFIITKKKIYKKGDDDYTMLGHV